MKVKAVATKLTCAQKKELNIDQRKQFEWQLTVNKEYLIISVRNIIGSSFYGNSVLLELEDDYGRLLFCPICLFQVVDDRPSRFWRVSLDGSNLSLQVKEFCDNPELSEKILDREPEALLEFEKIKAKLDAEFDN
ncbi:hypothetical protein BTJ40_07540 [Microbulbifer sp. A4B17]|uniref:hypothetical protein n=1 Tax=Microbulbifer sp. A4B17 TaxID=359370 RepID=UPI000D52AE1C|nr:hypothetical protein [Microbulbifer sp. A4B17]AWF80679.1 hypothetical protein BTJ40_07540 [Microbulbifer sp. A4B17]